MSTINRSSKTAELVFDWKKRIKDKQTKYIILSVISFIIAIVFSVTAFLIFKNANYTRILDNNMSYIRDSAQQRTDQIERELSFGEARIKHIANQLTGFVTTGNIETVDEMIDIYKDEVIFSDFMFIPASGILDGVDYSDKLYFQNASNGETGYIAMLESQIDTVLFYSPIYNGQEFIGALTGTFTQQKFDDMIAYEMFDYVPHTYLFKQDGMVITRSEGSLEVDNILEVLETKKFVGDTAYVDLIDVIQDETKTNISFSFIDEGQTLVGTIIQFENGRWFTLSVLSGDVTDSMLQRANRSGMMLLVSILVISLVLILILFSIFTRQRKNLENEINLATDSLELALEEEHKQFSIIGALVDVYSSVYYTDVSNMQYVRIKENVELSNIIDDEGETRQAYNSYVEQYVNDEYKGVMRDFLNVDTIPERLKAANVINCEYKRVGKGWHRATLAAVSYDEVGELTAFVLAVQPIDEEKTKELETQRALSQAYEAAQLASTAKTTFLSNMSHDIRTPMNAIIGMTAIAAANIDNKERVTDCLSKITISSKHLLGLINEVLDMSKIESGKVELAEEEFSFSDIINSLITLNQPLAAAKSQTLIVKIKDVKHENVIGDSIRLQQVFTNFLSNAIKYTPENGRIEVIVTEKETNKTNIGMYEVIFKDNGIGMSEEFLENLFVPFSRADDERVSKIQGTGLGMPIARNIIRMMNGDIIVESELNKGSTFKVSFALKIQDEEERTYDEFVDLDILVVDDDESACESTCEICNSLGMNSEYVMTGREAVEKTVHRHEINDDYYAVILDWKMPDLNGVETARQIRQRVGREVPIIVMSSYDWTEIEQEARAAGVDAFLSKPLFKSRFTRLFSELVNEKPEPKSSVTDQLENNDFSGKRVLLFEDNELNQEIAVEILSMIGIETEVAENGKVGLDMFQRAEKGYYDLIFMDIQMPVMNGYDAAAAIRSLSHPDAKLIPIVAMTANAFTSDIREAYNAGMNGHIAKPVDINQIIKVLHNHLDD